MATHSSIHAWRIPLTEEPGGLQSILRNGGISPLSHKGNLKSQFIRKDPDLERLQAGEGDNRG